MILTLVSTWRSFSCTMVKSEFQDSERWTFVRSAPSADACPFTRGDQGHWHWKMVDIELFTLVKLVLRPRLL